jgi:hypothetical protein
VPADGAPRGGRNADVAWVSYWYPQLAVYDDVVGWQTDQYMGNGEFYMGYGDYEVSITVPAGHLVAATGELENAAEVLSPAQRDRYAAAGTHRLGWSTSCRRTRCGQRSAAPGPRAGRRGGFARTTCATSPSASRRSGPGT